MARKAKRSGFKLRSGNTTSFKAMGSSPAKKQGSFITEFDVDLGEHVDKRVPYDEARAAEDAGKTVKYTHKEKERRDQEILEDFKKDVTDPVQREAHLKDVKESKKAQDREHELLTKKDPTYAKSTLIDEIAQKEIEGGDLTTRERRILDLARAQGADTTKSTKTPRTRTHLGEDTTYDQAVGASKERYKGSKTYGLEGYGRFDPRVSEANYKRYDEKRDDYRNLSDEDFEEKHGHKKGK